MSQSSSAAASHPQDAPDPFLQVETRPPKLIAARYDRLPFPNIGPVQEVALDVGITAVQEDAILTGMVFKGYSQRQLLFEQRWPARVIQARTGEDDLYIGHGTGLAVRGLHFMLHAYENLTHLEVTVVGKRARDGEAVQALATVPVVFHTQQVDLHFPLRGAWWTIQAGDWSDQHKVEVFSQPYALDFVKLGADNAFFSDTGMRLEEHYSWNQPVYAPAGGKVAYVCYDMPDMAPGQTPDQRMTRDDIRRTLGNAVAVSHANGEFSFFAHLQQASIQVNEGEMVRRGAILGRVGNSGFSPGPHLHFHLMEGPNVFLDQGLPAKFSHFSAGGQHFATPMTIPTRMIVLGPEAMQA